jgi:hypothetical protein
MAVILSDPRERRISAIQNEVYRYVRFFVATTLQNDRHIIFTLMRYQQGDFYRNVKGELAQDQ